ncbi:MAG: dTDP-4-dehydrorhamnose reductase [Bacteroidales bacterium]|nr:dTDP-4-dehydrorhamnose reductase [Bacteroidales bacterium]
MNILVTGSSGQLGRAIEELSRNSRHRFIFTSQGADDVGLRLDVTDAAAVSRAIGDGVDVIINCAAYTDVNAAEDNPSAAYAVNVSGAAVLADAAASSGALLIHVSTDYVFDGYANTPYREDDPTAPLNVYGMTKLEGEKAVIASGCRYIILRTSWLYGCRGRNFFLAIAEKTAECPRIKVVCDQIGSPTYAGDLAYAIMHILDNGMTGAEGIYHYSDEGLCSRYDFAKEICDSLGHICTIEPCRSVDYPSRAERPHYSVLDKSKFRETFGLEIPNWKDSLRLCVAEMENINK